MVCHSPRRPLNERALGTGSLAPNALRFCCGGLRRPPPSRQTYPARGRRAQAPASSKRGLGNTEPLGALWWIEEVDETHEAYEEYVLKAGFESLCQMQVPKRGKCWGKVVGWCAGPVEDEDQ